MASCIVLSVGHLGVRDNIKAEPLILMSAQTTLGHLLHQVLGGSENKLPNSKGATTGTGTEWGRWTDKDTLKYNREVKVERVQKKNPCSWGGEWVPC